LPPFFFLEVDWLKYWVSKSLIEGLRDGKVKLSSKRIKLGRYLIKRKVGVLRFYGSEGKGED